MSRIVVSQFITLDGVVEDPGGSEGFAAAWPSREGEFADKFNTMQKYVVSSTLKEPEWNNSTLVGLDEIAALKEREGGDILVNGSVQLVHGLMERDLVDEYRLMVFPVVLGRGKWLFAGGSDLRPLRLVECRPAGEVVILRLEPKPGS